MCPGEFRAVKNYEQEAAAEARKQEESGKVECRRVQEVSLCDTEVYHLNGIFLVSQALRL
jgi:hypothetical protein